MHHSPIVALAGLAFAVALAGGEASAQQASSTPPGAETEQRYDRGIQLGLGAGLVEPEEDTEKYFTAALRFRIDRYGNEPVWEGDHYRGRPPSEGGIRGYLEPEVGYWERSEEGVEETDLMVGLNLIGVVPTRGADFFMGVGFGVHFFDSQIDTPALRLDESEERLGGNLQVGVDVNLSRKLALFGTGRIDLLEGERNERQTKVVGGLRVKF